MRELPCARWGLSRNFQAERMLVMKTVMVTPALSVTFPCLT